MSIISTVTVPVGPMTVVLDEDGVVQSAKFAGRLTRTIGTIETPGHLLAQAQAKMGVKPVEAAPYVFEDADDASAHADALLEGHNDEQYFAGLQGLPWALAYDA